MSSSHSRKKILVVEDDVGIRRAVVDALKISGYEVEQTHSPEDAYQLASGGQFDLVLLDLVLPKGDGRNVLRKLRHDGLSLPVIIMTACGFETERVSGLQEGADDYVVKPFSVRELLARIAAVLRRSPQRQIRCQSLEYGAGLIHFERREILKGDGSKETLSERESELLYYLATHPDRTISRDELLQNVWKLAPNGINTRTIDMHIARLREKLGDSAAERQTLVTLRGKGYRFQTMDSSTSPNQNDSASNGQPS